MIISASRRTDIPAFFGDWFMKRIEEGYFHRVNPFNPKQVSAISLQPDDVEGIVFWTKNPRPFFKHLNSLEAKGYGFYFQYTLNDYTTLLEPHLPSVEKRVDAFKELSTRIGPERVIWRYDPIIVSNLTPVSYHIEKLETLARQLQGYTQRMVISFMDFYGKTENKIKKLQQKESILFTDISAPEYAEALNSLVHEISRIGAKYGMKVETCSEAMDLDHFGITHGSCVDAELISKLGKNPSMKKDKNQRGSCLCVESVDVGVYNTCKFNCLYCYAVQSEQAVNKTLHRHNPNSASLIGQYDLE